MLVWQLGAVTEQWIVRSKVACSNLGRSVELLFIVTVEFTVEFI